MNDLKVFTCACYSKKHVILVEPIDDDGSWKEYRVLIAVSMNQGDSFWTRLKSGLNWLFRKRGSFEYEEILLTESEADRMIATLQSLKKGTHDNDG